MNLMRSDLPRSFALCGALLLFGMASCKQPSQPSPEYAQARELFDQVFREKVLDAEYDPRMEQVLALLDKVDPRSSDAQAAQELKARIKTKRDAQAAAEVERAKMIQAVTAPPPMPPSAAAVPPPMPSASAAVDAKDAGVADDSVRTGLDASTFFSKHGDCFEVKNQFKVEGEQTTGDAYVLKDLNRCRDKYAAFTSSMVLLAGGKVFRITPSSEMKMSPPQAVQQPAPQAPKPAPPAEPSNP